MYSRLAIILVLFAISHQPATAKTTILVNFGPFHSVQEAANSETNVNWNDADLGDDTVCTECFAALELQHYLRKATGKDEDFRIQDAGSAPEGSLILVGGPSSNAATKRSLAILGLADNSLGSLGAQEYRLKSVEQQGQQVVLLAGGQRIGTLYAVYDFLHRVGCRWFAPGESQEEILPVKDIPLLDVSGRPSFLTRGFHATEDRGTPDFLLWMARNRLNSWCVEQGNHPLLHKLGISLECGGHEILHRFFSPQLPYPYAHSRWAASQSLPPDPYPVSPDFRGDANHDGQLSYGEAHPEWYGMRQGRRQNSASGFGGVDYCTSNPDATTEFMKNILQALADGPYRDASLIRFWMLDAGRWCDCDACRALGSPTDRNILLVNRLAHEIKQARAAGKLHRDILVRFLAYSDVIQPPTRPLPPNFDYQAAMATFYPIKRCYVHSFDDPACPVNAGFCRQLRGWATEPDRNYRGALCVGEYYNVSKFRNLPICFMHTMAHDIPYYHKQGVRNFEYMHVTTAKWGNKALTNYQMARQAWDEQTDCEALWADYFLRRYGAAGQTMRRFYETLEKMLSNVNELKYSFAPRLNQGQDPLFAGSHLRLQRQSGAEALGPSLLEMVDYGQQCRRLLAAARQSQVAPRIAARIAEDQRCFEYGERTVQYYTACAQAFELARQKKLPEARRQQAEAVRLGELLRSDTESLLNCYDFKISNTLEASQAPGALKRLETLLGPAQAKTVGDL